MTLSLVLFAACDAGSYGAPDGSTVSLNIEEITFTGGGSNDQDGIGLLYYDTLQVIGPDARPLNNIEVEIISRWPGIYTLSEQAVPEYLEFADDCGEDGEADQEDCDVFYAVDGEEYHELGVRYEYYEEFRPNVARATTDSRGMLRFYLFFDSIATSWVSFNIGVDNFNLIVTDAGTSE